MSNAAASSVHDHKVGIHNRALQRTAKSTRSGTRCQQAADGLGFAIPCPMLLPALSPGAVPPAPCDQRFRCLRGGGFVLEEDGFVVPPGYVGVVGQAHGRLVVVAAMVVSVLGRSELQQQLAMTVAEHTRVVSPVA